MSEAARKIVDRVSRRPAPTFLDLIALDPEFVGDRRLWIQDYNIVLWVGVSEVFAEALLGCREVIAPEPTSPFVYLADGGMVDLPIALRVRRYKEPRWLPVTFSIRKAASPPLVMDAV